jgi:acyl-ACP thioesterase
MPVQQFKYEVSYKVRSYEVDHHREASISTICNYFQEAAGLHAKELQFDISDLQKRGLTWILYKLQVKVHTFPKRWEPIKVSTWPSTGDGLRAYRDYELHDVNNDLLAVGLSQWMVLDIQKKRPVKMPDELMNSRFKTDKHVLEFYKNRLNDLSSENAKFITTVGLNDLDMNRHVNNVRYIDWITGHSRADKESSKKCDELIVHYASETKAGDKIYLSTKGELNQNKEMNHTLFKNDRKRIIANAKTHWR